MGEVDRQVDLFSTDPASSPLADRMRPQDFDEILGQDRILGPGTALRSAIERDDVGSLIPWGETAAPA